MCAMALPGTKQKLVMVFGLELAMDIEAPFVRL